MYYMFYNRNNIFMYSLYFVCMNNFKFLYIIYNKNQDDLCESSTTTFKNRTMTIVHNEKVLHPFQPYTTEAMSNQIEFFLTSLFH